MPGMETSCFFKGCERAATSDSVKCEFHKQRSICFVQNCRNQVFARNLCVRHGGKKTCIHEGCNENVRLGDLCGKHGAGSTRKMCIEPGCKKFAQTKMRCSAHGGGQRCKLQGCTTHARKGGYCTKHTNHSVYWPTSPTTSSSDAFDEASVNILFESKGCLPNKLSLSAILNPTIVEL